MKIKVIFVVLFLIGMAAGAFFMDKFKNKEFARTEKVYNKVIDRYAASNDSLAKKATYSISQTFTQKKNKKGQTIFIPTSTMEIKKFIEEIDKNIKNSIDSIQNEATEPRQSLWNRIFK